MEEGDGKKDADDSANLTHFILIPSRLAAVECESFLGSRWENESIGWHDGWVVRAAPGGSRGSGLTRGVTRLH